MPTIQGVWKRVPTLLLIDRGISAAAHTALMRRLAALARTMRVNQFPDIPSMLPAELDKMRSDGHHRQIHDKFPYDIDANIVACAMNNVFKSVRKGLTISPTPAEPYGSFNHTVINREDYIRLAHQYLSVQDPYTLSFVYSFDNSTRPPDIAWIESNVNMNLDVILPFAKTISASLVIATTACAKIPKTSHCHALGDTGDEADAVEFADEVVLCACELFAQVRSETK